MTPEGLKIGGTVLSLIIVLVLSGFIVVFFFIRNDSKRITWIENEFYKRENANRTARLTGEMRDLQEDGR